MSDPADHVLTRLEGATRWLIFNRPDKHNALSLEMSERALEIVTAFAGADDERVLVVAGSGGRAFVSGADISEFDAKRNNAETADEYGRLTTRMFFAIRDALKPTVAMIEGYCFGGGVALATACDIRLCAEDSLFAVPAARLGVGYSADYLKMLTDIIGPSRTKEMLYTARRYGAEEALQMGLVNRIIPKADLESTVRDYAAGMAENAPLTQRATKGIVNDLVKPASEQDPALRKRLIDACMDSEDFKNARRAFMAKEKPVFTGR